MKPGVKLILAGVVLAGCLGVLTAPRPQAQGKPPAPAYVVNEIDVTDAAGFATYATRQGALVDRFGGHFLARGGQAVSVNGAVPKRITIYVFDSMAKAQAWQDAPEQKDLDIIRDRASHFRSFIVEGCANCAAPGG
jgi:uncharacterized protein (DUF1330 family)